jgi:hypothetical protein
MAIRRATISIDENSRWLPVKGVLQLLEDRCSESKRDLLLEIGMHFAIAHFFRLADGVVRAKECKQTPVLDVHYSKLLENPEHTLKSILQFLSLEGDIKYYAKCASVLKPEHKSRFLHPKLYPPQRVEMIGKRIRKYEWYKSYTYKN